MLHLIFPPYHLAPWLCGRQVTTTAQGEGAIEGVISDYEMRSAFDTRFKFSRFDDVIAQGARLPMNATIMAPPVVAFTETDEALGV